MRERLARMLCALSMALFVGLFLPRPAVAEIKTGDQIVGLNLGLGVPFARNYTEGQRLANPGIDFGAQYLYHLKPALGVGAEANYNLYGIRHHLDSRGSSVGANYHSWDVQIVGRYVFMADQKLNPYAIVGLGVGQVIETDYDDLVTGLAYSVGLGADYSITDHILAGLEFRWQGIGCARTVTVGPRERGLDMPADTNIKIAAKIGYKFGGK